MAVDFLNQPLEVNAVVIMTLPKYADICVGVVKKVTPQRVRVVYRDHNDYASEIVVEHGTVMVTTHEVALKRARFIRLKAVEADLLNRADMNDGDLPAGR